MQSDIATGICALSSRFDEVDALTEAVQQWDLHFTQLDRGRFDGRLFHLRWNGLQLQRARFGRALEQHGSAPAGMRTFGIPATPDFSILWRGHRVRGSDIMIFPSSGELHSVSDPGFDVFTFSVSERLLDEVATRAGLPWPGPPARGQEVLVCDDDAMDRLRALLMGLTDRFEAARGGTTASWSREELAFALPRSVLATLSAGRVAMPAPTSRLRSMALHRADEFIADHSDESVRVSDLCRATGVSERTLRYTFLDKFGIAPKAYLMARQLGLARRALRRADPHSDSVAEIAGRFGFWHMGQFAADYRRQFGELPSATFRGSVVE